jgi:hypothetical protein
LMPFCHSRPISVPRRHRSRNTQQLVTYYREVRPIAWRSMLLFPHAAVHLRPRNPM